MSVAVFWIVCAILYSQILLNTFILIRLMNHEFPNMILLRWHQFSLVVFVVLLVVLFGIHLHWIAGILVFVLMPLLSGLGLCGMASIIKAIESVFQRK